MIYCLERGFLPWNDHEFLERKPAASMRSTIEDIHKRNGQHKGFFGACQIGHMDIERDFLQR